MILNTKKWHIPVNMFCLIPSISFKVPVWKPRLNFQCIVLNFNETIKKHITSLQQYIFLTNMNDESVISL